MSARRTLARLLGPLGLLTLSAACDSNPAPPAPGAGASTKPPAATGAPQRASAAAPAGAPKAPETSLKWTVPAAWSLVPSPSPMRLATYQIPKPEGASEGAELTVAKAGGDVGSNVTRWKTQFEGAGEPKSSERAVNGLKVTVVEIEGAYKGMAMPGADAAGPKADYAMLAAIVEQEGQDHHFFKLVGPKAAVEQARAGFEELVGSVAPR